MKAVELFRIVHSDQTPECHMYLRETEGERVFPIIIAANEMAEIHRKVHGIETRRPMTHDLLGRLMEQTKVSLERVEITELKSEVFYALMHFRTEGGETFTIDARPSDAVAIATGVSAPLFANERILDEIGVREAEDEGEAGGPPGPSKEDGPLTDGPSTEGDGGGPGDEEGPGGASGESGGMAEGG